MLKVRIAEPPKTSEPMVQSALAAHFDWSRNYCFTCVSMWNWEQDFVVITEAMKVWEVEIKLSRADWKIDGEKTKWESQHFAKVSRFYYCVPGELLKMQGRHCKPVIPDFVPEYAGLLAFFLVGKQWRIFEVRPAKNRSTFKISLIWLQRLLRSSYYKFWLTRKHPPNSGAFFQAQDPAQSIAPP
jgi:hypothetical protein